MGFVREGDPDVFVSYASLDNQDGAPWVTNLVRDLRSQLGPRLGSKTVHIWRDYEGLDGNHPFTPKILESVRRSATLLIIMSEGYLASGWCARERNEFLNVARGRVAEGRVFIVHYRGTDRKARPREFADLLGYKFWTEDADAGGAKRPLGWPDFREPAYLRGILNLNDKLATKLEELKTQGPPTNPVCVFLARSTDDMLEREEELKSHLIQAGLTILPETWYPEGDEQVFRAAMQADLSRCSAFAQLLGQLPGRRLGGAGGRRLPAVQYETSRDVKKPIPVLQWRDPAENLAAITDTDHRVLVEGARASGFEEFKRAVVEDARRKPEPNFPQLPPGTVFVNADRDDLDLAQEISAWLCTQGVGSYLPILQGKPGEVRRNLKKNLKICDGLILVYGMAPPLWVQEQLRQRHKIRERAFSAQALYLAPPPEKTRVGEFPEIMMLDGRQGLTPEIMRRFVDRMNTATVER
jgi:hypothetical protein